MAKTSLRGLIVEILQEVIYKNRFLKESLHEKDYSAFENPEKALGFAETVTRGVIERLPFLSYVLSEVSTVPEKKMRPKIRLILLSGAYQILFMQTEDYAAVNESVKLASAMGFSSLKGFVNGVLRHISREKESFFKTAGDKEKSGLPGELYDLYVSWFGKENTDKICEADLSAGTKEFYVRKMSGFSAAEFEAALEKEGISFKRDPFYENLYSLRSFGSIERSSVFQAGMFYVQSPGSFMATEIGKDLFSFGNDGFSVLDACASPGGKTVGARDKMAGRGHILSCDVSLEKLSDISENLKRYSFDNVSLLVRDAAVYEPEFREKFDVVIADLPCSGLGTVSHKPEIRLHVQEASLKELSALQKKILDNLSLYVRPGGTLLFSTCTLCPWENEDNFRYFLEKHPAFSGDDISAFLPENLRFDSAKAGFLQILPGISGNEGFFISRLTKKNSSSVY